MVPSRNATAVSAFAHGKMIKSPLRGGHAVRCLLQVKVDVLNPKAISVGELYGQFNPFTMEWRDGIGSSLMRRAAEANTKVAHNMRNSVENSTNCFFIGHHVGIAWKLCIHGVQDLYNDP